MVLEPYSGTSAVVVFDSIDERVVVVVNVTTPTKLEN